MENEILDEIENEKLLLESKRNITLINYVCSLLLILGGMIMIIVAYKFYEFYQNLSPYTYPFVSEEFLFTQMFFGILISINGYLIFKEKIVGLKMMKLIGLGMVIFSIVMFWQDTGIFIEIISKYGGFLVFGIVLLFYSQWKKLHLVYY